MPAQFPGSASAKIYLSIRSSGASRHKKGGLVKGEQAEHDEVAGNLISGGKIPFPRRQTKKCTAA
jgi:hypothetical protein